MKANAKVTMKAKMKPKVNVKAKVKVKVKVVAKAKAKTKVKVEVICNVLRCEICNHEEALGDQHRTNIQKRLGIEGQKEIYTGLEGWELLRWAVTRACVGQSDSTVSLSVCWLTRIGSMCVAGQAESVPSVEHSG